MITHNPNNEGQAPEVVTQGQLTGHKPLTHLTLTGPQAGRVICGAPKVAADRRLHGMYAPIEKLHAGTIPDFPPLCEECYRIWMCDCDEDGTINTQCKIHGQTSGK